MAVVEKVAVAVAVVVVAVAGAAVVAAARHLPLRSSSPSFDRVIMMNSV